MSLAFEVVEDPARACAALMVGAGLQLDHSWTDPDGDFALSLATVPTWGEGRGAQ